MEKPEDNIGKTIVYTLNGECIHSGVIVAIDWNSAFCKHDFTYVVFENDGQRRRWNPKLHVVFDQALSICIGPNPWHDANLSDEVQPD